MSGKKLTINGVPFASAERGMENGTYKLIFTQAEAPLSKLEKLDWSRPNVTGDSVLPAGYGYVLQSIIYKPLYECTEVVLKVDSQYLGDVTGYTAQVAELEGRLAEQSAAVQALEEQLAETDEALIALYEAQESGEVSA